MTRCSQVKKRDVRVTVILLSHAAETFPLVPGYEHVKNFLRIVLLVIAAIVAVKFLPLIFAFGWLLAGAVLGLLVLAGSAIATLMGSAFVLAAVLSPIWIPLLALIGIIALVKRSNRKSVGLVA